MCGQSSQTSCMHKLMHCVWQIIDVSHCLLWWWWRPVDSHLRRTISAISIRNLNQQSQQSHLWIPTLPKQSQHCIARSIHLNCIMKFQDTELLSVLYSSIFLSQIESAKNYFQISNTQFKILNTSQIPQTLQRRERCWSLPRWSSSSLCPSWDPFQTACHTS